MNGNSSIIIIRVLGGQQRHKGRRENHQFEPISAPPFALASRRPQKSCAALQARPLWGRAGAPLCARYEHTGADLTSRQRAQREQHTLSLLNELTLLPLGGRRQQCAPTNGRVKADDFTLIFIEFQQPGSLARLRPKCRWGADMSLCHRATAATTARLNSLICCPAAPVAGNAAALFTAAAPALV